MKKQKNNVLIALRYLYVHECCYKSDFLLFFKDDKRPNQTYDRLTKQMKKSLSTDGILEREIPTQGAKKKSGMKQTIVTLSLEGIEYYKKFETDNFYQSLKIKHSKIFYLESDSGYTRTLYPHLTQQKVNIMYICAGVNVDSYTKPSLYLLSYYLSTNPTSLSLSDPKIQKACRRYYDDELIHSNLSRDEKENILNNFIKNGLYYTKEEVRNYLKLINLNITDTFKSVNWQGIYFTDKTFLVNFALGYVRNQRYVVSDAELKNMLRIFKERIMIPFAPDVNRKISVVSDGERYQNKIDAVTIGIGTSHVYTESIGRKFGKIKKTTPKRKYDSKSSRVDILDCHSINFSRIYSIVDNKGGINMLQYLCLYSLEDYHDEEVALFSENPDMFKLTNMSNLYPATYTLYKIPAIYIPVYEIKLLNKISEQMSEHNSALVVCCKKEMMETISHCLRMYNGGDDDGKIFPALYFFEVVDDGDETKLKEKMYNPGSGLYNVYDREGYIKGRRMIDEYLARKNLKINSEVDYAILARKIRRGNSSNESSDFEVKAKMYNNIAYYPEAESYIQKIINMYGDESNNPDTVYIVPINKKEKVKRIHYNKTLDISMSPDLKRKINHTAKDLSVSSSSVVRQAVTEIMALSERLEQSYVFDKSGEDKNTYSSSWEMAVDMVKKLNKPN